MTAWKVVALRRLLWQRRASQYFGNFELGLSRCASAMGRRIQAGRPSRPTLPPSLIGRRAQYHLAKVFRKLGVTSRTQLARILVD